MGKWNGESETRKLNMAEQFEKLTASLRITDFIFPNQEHWRESGLYISSLTREYTV